MKKILAKISLIIIALAVGYVFIHQLYLVPIREAQTPDWTFQNYLLHVGLSTLIYALIIAAIYYLFKFVTWLSEIIDPSEKREILELDRKEIQRIIRLLYRDQNDFPASSTTYIDSEKLHYKIINHLKANRSSPTTNILITDSPITDSPNIDEPFPDFTK